MTIISSRLFIQRLKNLSVSLLLIAAVMGGYAVIPYSQQYFSAHTHFFSEEFTRWQILLTATLSYIFLLVVFYLSEKNPGTSKSIHCLHALRRLTSSPLMTLRTGLPANERLGLLSVLLKAFFAPLMVVWLFDHTALMLINGSALLTDWKNPEMNWLSLFNNHGFWFLFKLILFLDVVFFTIGYLIELPALKNEIRSVDPTLLGWVVTLACYPPFNNLTSKIFGGGYSADFPQFDHPIFHVTANTLLLGLMAIYTSASIALNLKASNLTHRGIVSHGPYRFIRHPAYACKNLAWWIGLGPALILATQTSLIATLMTVGSMFGWSVIYYMRALTEEDHLRSVDDTYNQYCQKVKYRFIPGII
jgi:protein-S-isoprenylcysteine O-methyltransferase Ste14